TRRARSALSCGSRGMIHLGAHSLGRLRAGEPLSEPRGRSRGIASIGIGAECLAAIAAGERLVDADLGLRARDGRRIPSPLGPAAGDQRAVGAGIQWPRVDRLLEEVDRAVQEGEVAAAGVEARGCQDYVIALVMVAVADADLPLRVHRVEGREERVA